MINQLFLVKFDWLGEAKKTQAIPNSSVKFGIFPLFTFYDFLRNILKFKVSCHNWNLNFKH